MGYELELEEDVKLEQDDIIEEENAEDKKSDSKLKINN